MKSKPMDHKHSINPIYKILFLPLISIDTIVFSQKNLINKAFALVFPTILLFIWGIAWTILVMLGALLLGINLHTTGEYISLVTIIWTVFLIGIPIIKKQKKMNIIYGLVSVAVFLFFVNMFIMRMTVIHGTSMEPAISNGATIYVYRLSNYRINDIVIYIDPDSSGVQRIGRIILLPENLDPSSGYVIKADNKGIQSKPILEKDIIGRVINYK